MAKLKVISLSVESDMHDKMQVSAKKLGLPVSAMMRNLVEKYMDLLVNDGEEIPVVLKIPADLKGEELYNWLNIKSKAIADALNEPQT